MRRLFRIALEEASDGKANQEIEHTFYARLSPDQMEQLKKAQSVEHHEQWEVKIPETEKNAGSGRIRIRETVAPEKDPEYVLTVKTITNKEGDRIEVPVPTTKDMFHQFKLLADEGMVKTRYVFPIEGSDMKWEIDMFYAPGGVVGTQHYAEWCKIDLEVKDRTAAIPPFPIQMEEVINGARGQRTEQEEEKLHQLFQEIFITKNPFKE